MPFRTTLNRRRLASGTCQSCDHPNWCSRNYKVYSRQTSLLGGKYLLLCSDARVYITSNDVSISVTKWETLCAGGYIRRPSWSRDDTREGFSSYYWSEMSSISLPKNVSFLDANLVIIGCALVSGFKDSLFFKSKDLAKAYSWHTPYTRDTSLPLDKLL